MRSTSQTTRVPLQVARSRRVADEWALVLASEGMHPQVSRASEGFAVDVPEEEVGRAFASLAEYHDENPPTKTVIEPAPPIDFTTGMVFGTLLLVFFAVTGPRDFDVAWFARGSADSVRILQGETWRVMTALTLHADSGHVLGNALAGALFVGAVCGALGAGVGIALVLSAGALGNLANALVQTEQHISVGASTAIFGAVGILATLGVRRYHARGARGRRVLVPVAAGLGLLAMLGTGPRADLSAHVLGLVAGAALGLVCARRLPRPPNALIQCALLAASAIAVWASWSAAFR